MAMRMSLPQVHRHRKLAQRSRAANAFGCGSLYGDITTLIIR
jgi:hypothetical protein